MKFRVSIMSALLLSVALAPTGFAAQRMTSAERRTLDGANDDSAATAILTKIGLCELRRGPAISQREADLLIRVTKASAKREIKKVRANVASTRSALLTRGLSAEEKETYRSYLDTAPEEIQKIEAGQARMEERARAAVVPSEVCGQSRDEESNGHLPVESVQGEISPAR